ncbi:transcription initiation factor IID, 31 kDa subunit (macronuclear) [Tetrahymena thermophila SB210]|uniref:Transcription initiation factor IID, 31 kDa subunit n=1 Tax=Tetrahymena thermophila (strain SB210) TaxID=312017 RepID=Q22W41_TETTS|nr:transcription initiation factor IID, 31 kDa subunit [Tetrahymena thermophila SB210]EAR89576.2 transcription initiation factor IID, 31 kDa subunit [Tetrahymena thermophila SB210]|eukprot:XP_001009821.2 transcription initiation factor IID, 31 kDa subunit [Tetrahymena thermophila SB210]
MASGQEIVDRILKTYGVEFDSTVSGKLNEFMIRYTIDILRLAKNYSIFEQKDTFSLIEVRQAIKLMKENKGVAFDEMQSIFKQMSTQNLEEDIQKTSIYNQIFQYDENALLKWQLKTEISEEMREEIERRKIENKKIQQEKKDNPDIFKEEVRFGNQQPVQTYTKPAVEEDDDYE